ncbi:hypothetical protein [Actinomadura chokoriensis]|uniref:hypothetical protein n=1 Tax=Actinomadura chokoriensis TaxID=454156 RepID=UPI0031F8806B
MLQTPVTPVPTPPTITSPQARLALNQIHTRLRRQVIIRSDSGGGTHEFPDWVTTSRIEYSIWFNLNDDICAAILALPEHVWQCAYDADRQLAAPAGLEPPGTAAPRRRT